MTETESLIKINPFSIVSVFIEMLFNDSKLGCGTAFFVEREEQKYLITNWHNLSGRDPKTRKTLHSQAAVPNKIRIYKHDSNCLGKATPIDYPLVNEDEKPIWFEHPVHGSGIDVGVLPIEKARDVYTINKAEQELDPYEKWPIQVGESVFVLGFPFGLSGSSYFPIWKAASIASEPEIDLNNLPFFYIDTATRPGMSGSPVIQRERRAVSIRGKQGFSRFRCNFLGVYSGRIGADNELAAQLGRVWKVSCLPEIIDGKKIADADF